MILNTDGHGLRGSQN